MSENGKEPPWIDGRVFTDNVNNFPTAELWKHIGEHIAWSLDGTQILAGDRDPSELIRKLDAAGLRGGHYVLDYVYDPDTSLIY